MDAFSTRRHYSAHLLPIWEALPAEVKGTFYAVSEAEKVVGHLPEFVRRRPRPSQSRGFLLTAAWSDAKGQPDVILVDHGAGQRYDGDRVRARPEYVGGGSRDNVVLFLEPGPHAASITRATSDAPCLEVGVPYLKPWLDGTRPRGHGRGTVAVSFHWRCALCPETSWAWPEYRSKFAELTESYDLIGHAHPRAWARLGKWWESIGVEPVKDWFEVLDRADVFVIDNSSALFEWCLTDRPVVVLNASTYRRDVDHGLRFWWGADVGEQVDDPEELAPALDRALDGFVPESRGCILPRVYADTDVIRAVEAVCDLG